MSTTTHEVPREAALHAATKAVTKASDLHICFKPGTATNVALDIVEQMLAGKQWGDEFVLTAGPDSRNCIGTSFRRLQNVELVQNTGQHRRSAVAAQKGRVVWRYSLPNVALARLFLSRNGRVPVEPQMDFFK